MAENDLNAHPIAGEADGWGERTLQRVWMMALIQKTVENDEEENVALL